MRICPVCPVMEIIVPVDVTDVEQEVVRVLWDLQDQPVPEAVREFRGLWILRDRRGSREYRDIREPPVRQELPAQQEQWELLVRQELPAQRGQWEPLVQREQLGQPVRQELPVQREQREPPVQQELPALQEKLEQQVRPEQ